MSEFRMPSLGADMEAGTLVAWRAQPGDVLNKGDIIAEVETDKGVIEVEVFAAGRVERFLVEPGTKVPVGTPLAIVEDTETASIAEAAVAKGDPPQAEPKPQLPAVAVNVKRPTAPVRDVSTRRVSPYARRRSKELKVDLDKVQPVGSTGVIRAADVERSAHAGEGRPSVAADELTTLTGARRAIAMAMERSKREIPHYYLSTTIDFEPAQTWLQQRNHERSIEMRLLPGALLVKAVALATRNMPQFNASFEHGQLCDHDAIHVGTAISLRGGGLVAPAVHDADRLDLDAVMAALQDLVARARSGALRSSELSDSTITVTSLGERGVEMVTPIIVPPQTAILGFGRIVVRPWVVDDAIVARPLLTATLAADHRVTDGHLGGRLLALIDHLLQRPADL